MSIWRDFMNTIRGNFRPEREHKTVPAAADDSKNRPLIADADIPPIENPYERGRDAAAQRGDFKGAGMTVETPYPQNSVEETLFRQGYDYEAQAIDRQRELRRKDSDNSPLTPDYDPKRGPQC